MGVSEIKVELLEDFCIAVLENDWVNLQSRADHRFFMSWHWINSWLVSFPVKPQLLKATYKGEVVGLALLCFQNIKRHYIFPVNRILVHETGKPDYDQQWIEYNSFLIDKNLTEQVLLSMVKKILTDDTWDEFYLGVTDSVTVQKLSSLLDLPAYIEWKTRAHWIDLEHIRNNFPTYLSSLSKNARAQIRRSIKLYEKIAPISINHAKSTHQASEMLGEIAPLHIERWGSGYQESGFANPLFVEFHQNIIKTSFDDGCIDIICVSAGDKKIAYFYNFIYQNNVYFYLSALSYEQDNRLKPGLVGHALCIEEYLQRGFHFYDLMGGGEVYKDRLADYHDDFFRVSFKRTRLKLVIESTLRQLKQRLIS